MKFAGIAWLAALLSAGAALGDGPKTIHYIGAIDGNLGVSMTLTTADAGELSGNYFYLRHGDLLFLKGKRDGNELELQERSRLDADTGAFSLKANADNGFSGVWTDPEKKRKLPVELKPVAETAALSTGRQGVYLVETGYLKFNGDSSFVAALNDALAHRAEKRHLNSVKEIGSMAEQDHALAGVAAVYERKVFPCVMYLSQTLVSIRDTVGEYTGGAHTNYTYEVLNYAWQNGKLKQLAPGDLVSMTPEAMKLLRDKVVKQLKLQQAQDADDVHLDADKNQPHLNFTSEGLVLTYAPYMVGPFAQGTMTVALPWKNLGGIVGDKSALKPLIK